MPIPKPPRVLVGVRLPVPLVEKMREEADRRGMKLQAFVEQALVLYMLGLKLRRASRKRGS